MPIGLVRTALILKISVASVAARNMNLFKKTKLIKHDQIIELATSKLVVLEEFYLKSYES